MAESTDTVMVKLTIEECTVADDLERSAQYGTEWDNVLESAAQKLRDAKAAAENG